MSFKDKMHKPAVITGTIAASLLMAGTMAVSSASADTTPTPTPLRPVPVRQCATVPTTFFTPRVSPNPDNQVTDETSPSDEVSPTDEASPLGRVHPSSTPTINPPAAARSDFHGMVLVSRELC
jgi:hypothetical protein